MRVSQALLYLLALTAPLAQLPLPFVSGSSLRLQFFDGIACLSAWAAAFYFFRAPKPERLLPLIYPLALSLSVCFSVRPELSAAPMARALYLAGLACTVQVLLGQSNERGLKSLRLGWLCGLALVCLSVFLGVALFYCGYETQAANPFLFHHGTLGAGNFPRVCGSFFNANLLCNYLLVSLAWVGRGWRVPVVVLALATLSPGLGPIALFVLWSFRWVPFRIAGVVLAIVAYLLTWTYPGEVLRGQPRLAGPRVECWQQSANLWLQSPWLGRGPGQANFTIGWQDPDGGRGALSDPHNTFLSLLSQGGVLALGVVLFLFLRRRVEANRGLFLAVNLALWLDGLTGSFEDARHLWLALGAFSASGAWASLDQTLVEVGEAEAPQHQ